MTARLSQADLDDMGRHMDPELREALHVDLDAPDDPNGWWIEYAKRNREEVEHVLACVDSRIATIARSVLAAAKVAQ